VPIRGVRRLTVHFHLLRTRSGRRKNQRRYWSSGSKVRRCCQTRMLQKSVVLREWILNNLAHIHSLTMGVHQRSEAPMRGHRCCSQQSLRGIQMTKLDQPKTPRKERRSWSLGIPVRSRRVVHWLILGLRTSVLMRARRRLSSLVLNQMVVHLLILDQQTNVLMKARCHLNVVPSRMAVDFHIQMMYVERRKSVQKDRRKNALKEQRWTSQGTTVRRTVPGCENQRPHRSCLVRLHCCETRQHCRSCLIPDR
jgi:hypothetical protein